MRASHVVPRSSLSLSLILLSTAPSLFALQAPGSRPAAVLAKQMAPEDLRGWKTIRQSVLSDDGKWFAYIVGPNEGAAEVVIRSLADSGKEWRYPIGEAARGGGRGGAAGEGGGGTSLVVTADGAWAAFTVLPARSGTRGGRGGRGGGPGGGTAATAAGGNFNRMALVDLATGQKKEFQRVRRFAFNGERPDWVALHGYPESAETGTTGTAGTGRGAAGAGGTTTPAAGRPDGTDLVLYRLSDGQVVNVGNVAEFAFDKTGDWLAYTIDARERLGNGVQLRHMKTDVVRPIDGADALYRRLVWADSQPALAVLRGHVDTLTRDTLFSVVTVTAISAVPAPAFKKTVFDPTGRRDFPAGMKVTADRTPRFASDLATVFFGIREAKKAPPPGESAVASRNGDNLIAPGAPGAGGTVNQPRASGGDDENENPSLVLWHGNDPRLQSQQIVQEQQDRSFTYLAHYRLGEDKFVQLADSALRSVNTVGRDQYAYGIDTREYDQPASYSGRRFQDIYAVDVRTSQRKLLLKKHPSAFLMPSPDGKQLLFWGANAQYWVLDVATGEKRDVSSGVPTVFADTSDDHNNLVTPPNNALGWTKDGSAVLLSDGFDVWRVPVKGGAAVNLTVNGARDQIRYQRLYDFDATAAPGGGGGGRGGRGGGRPEGIDLSKPLYFGTYGEWTKKEGLARVAPNKPGATPLVTEDARLTFQKAKNADVYLYTRQTASSFPNYHVAGRDFAAGRQITDVNPQQKDFSWTGGSRLINYTSEKGDKLQGALYLPANYEPGKKYPLLVTIYEKRSNQANSYVTPNETSTPNRSIYTSRGYAVLDPDIVYRVNDPGMSAVWCVIPAVKAAIATGLIDSTNVGIWGHSWGGYQTAFLVTQTPLFKAAIAGAALTDMVSMYSSVYWNTGGANQAIFESSQGRFKGNFIDNYEAYIRNSPVFHAHKVKTPLLLLHNDKDGAVDFNQGIIYFNTLRQLGKQVILLEYVGENHGLARPVNQKDYAVRQREWFDHYLRGMPAPDWMTKGIPRIRMEEYWNEQKKATAATIMQ